MAASLAEKRAEIAEVAPEGQRRVVRTLLEICCLQQEEIQRLRELVEALKEENAELKGQKPRPQIRPSVLEKDSAGRRGKAKGRKRGRGVGRRKTDRLEIHQTVIVSPDWLPEGSRFKGYQNFMVQDLQIRAHNTLYRLERWETPWGESVVGRLPEEVAGLQVSR